MTTMRMRRRRARASRLSGISINRMLPNILTTLALCAGLTAVRYAVQERWQVAVIAILIAAVLDGLDGRLARLLRVSSKFGAELDSLADFVSFGVAPVIILYLWTLQDAGGFGWIVVLAYCVCAALRLARFNVRLGQPDLPPWVNQYFSGVPSPAAAGLVLMPMLFHFQFGLAVPGGPVLVGLWTVAVGLLMVSPLPTFSLKGGRVPHRWIMPTLLGVGLLAALLVTEPWATLLVAGGAYLATMPLSYRRYRALQRETARPAPDAQGADVQGPAGQSTTAVEPTPWAMR